MAEHEAGSHAVDRPSDRVSRISGRLRLSRGDLVLAAVTTVVLAVELVVLLARSRDQWAGGSLSLDFAIFHQAWSRIADGDLNPTVTVGDYPYIQSHFELIMWPLALLGVVFPSGFTLLVVQDVALVITQALVVLRVRQAALGGRGGGWWPPTLALLALGLLATNPHVYRTATSDFHFQHLATMLVVGAALALFCRRRRAAWICVAFALTTGDVAGTYVFGLGLSALVAARDLRRTGLAMMGAGLAWVAFVALLGANRGSQIGGYSHLVARICPGARPGCSCS